MQWLNVQSNDAIFLEAEDRESQRKRVGQENALYEIRTQVSKMEKSRWRKKCNEHTHNTILNALLVGQNPVSLKEYLNA